MIVRYVTRVEYHLYNFFGSGDGNRNNSCNQHLTAALSVRDEDHLAGGQKYLSGLSQFGNNPLEISPQISLIRRGLKDLVEAPGREERVAIRGRTQPF